MTKYNLRPIEEVLTLEERIKRVGEKIESMRASLNYLDNSQKKFMMFRLRNYEARYKELKGVEYK